MWKHLIELCLRNNSYEEILENGLTEPENEKGLNEEEKLQLVRDRSLSEKALFLICQFVELPIMKKIFHGKKSLEYFIKNI